MYFDDHNPPHFHAKYNSDKIVIEINSMKVLDGFLPSRALGLVMEWASLHKNQLLINWENAKNGKELINIEPL
ncbi:MAG TPA: DUF4160 domain-containing protein [Candidatus Kapabacteria bacterium]|nr:DUF4160 domain-containing protein [Candidatus Kapabacteria bacterium]